MRCFFLLLAFLFGEPHVQVDESDRVPNRTSWQCAYAVLETMARHVDLDRLVDLTKEATNQGVASEDRLIALLRDRGVACRYYPKGSVRNYRQIEEWVAREHRPVLIGIQVMIPFDEDRLVVTPYGLHTQRVRVNRMFGHALLLVHFDDEKVQFIDPNDVKLKQWGRAEFEGYWDGFAIVLDKRKETECFTDPRDVFVCPKKSPDSGR